MKKPKKPRVRLTHFEVRRGDTLRLRIAVNDDAIGEIGDTLGALLRRAAPGAVAAEPTEHMHDDTELHENMREYLSDFFSSLCDASLTDALEIAHEERVRRSADWSN